MTPPIGSIPEGMMELSEKATAGEWRVEPDTTLIWGKCDPQDDTTYGFGYPVAEGKLDLGNWRRVGREARPQEAEANAAFIVACVNYVRSQLSAGQGCRQPAISGASEKEADYTREDYHRLHGQLVDTQDRLNEAQSVANAKLDEIADLRQQLEAALSIRPPAKGPASEALQLCLDELRSIHALHGDEQNGREHSAAIRAAEAALEVEPSTLKAKGAVTDEAVEAALDAYFSMPVETLKNRMRAALEASLPLVTEGWKPISSAPKDRRNVLVFGPHETRGSYIEVTHFWVDRWVIEWMDGYGAPTHWDHLPAAPAPTDQKREEPRHGDGAPSETAVQRQPTAKEG